MIERIPQGLSIAIPPTSPASMGMRNGFTIDIHRMALLPLTPDWFPDMEKSGLVIGHASHPALTMGPPLISRSPDKNAK